MKGPFKKLDVLFEAGFCEVAFISKALKVDGGQLAASWEK